MLWPLVVTKYYATSGCKRSLVGPEIAHHYCRFLAVSNSSSGCLSSLAALLTAQYLFLPNCKNTALDFYLAQRSNRWLILILLVKVIQKV